MENKKRGKVMFAFVILLSLSSNNVMKTNVNLFWKTLKMKY